MKKLFVTLFLSISLSCFSQYIPIQNNAVWTCSFGNVMDGYYQGNHFSYFLYGDTVIDGKSYRKLNLTEDDNQLITALIDSTFTTWVNLGNYAFVGGIREDSAKKVWYTCLKNIGLNIINENDTTEHLLYDFGMNIGDTIRYNDTNVNEIFSSLPYYAVLTDTSSIYFANKQRKVFQYSGLHIFNQTYIEGIGSAEGILAPLKEDFEMFNNMLCFNSFETAVGTWQYYFGTPCPCTLGLNVNSIDIAGINFIFPNPTSGEINLLKSANNVQIISTDGKLIFESFKNGQQHFDFNYLNNGIYIFKYNSDNMIHVEKLVICK